MTPYAYNVQENGSETEKKNKKVGLIALILSILAIAFTLLLFATPLVDLIVYGRSDGSALISSAVLDALIYIPAAVMILLFSVSLIKEKDKRILLAIGYGMIALFFYGPSLIFRLRSLFLNIGAYEHFPITVLILSEILPLVMLILNFTLFSISCVVSFSKKYNKLFNIIRLIAPCAAVVYEVIKCFDYIKMYNYYYYSLGSSVFDLITIIVNVLIFAALIIIAISKLKKKKV